MNLEFLFRGAKHVLNVHCHCFYNYDDDESSHLFPFLANFFTGFAGCHSSISNYVSSGVGWCRGSTFSTLYKWEYRKTQGICVLLLLYLELCFPFLLFVSQGCCFLIYLIYVSKRVSSIQLVVTWCTLQQHLSMHLTTSHPTSTGILESLSSIHFYLWNVLDENWISI